MKLFVQWVHATPRDWQEVESVVWSVLPRKPVPRGGEGIDDAPGWVAALCVQGVEFTGYDHYAVEDLLNGSGGIRVLVWNDDPEDRAGGLGARFPGFYGQVWTFAPLEPDPAFGGAYNTRQTMAYYAEPGVVDYLAGRVAGFEGGHPVRPWQEFVLPPDARVRHGIWVSDQHFARHRAVQTRHGWREWTDGVPPELLEGGRIRPQRPMGRFRKATGTQTFYQRDTNVASGVHVATNEDDLNAAAGTGQTENSGNLNAGASSLDFLFTTAANVPNSADWPNGTYRCELDVSAAGANVSYGLLTLNGSAGHFGRVDSGLTADKETAVQAEAAFTGTGLKLATVVWNPAAGAAGDRLECLVAGKNSATMNAAQSFRLTFDADGFVDGPWTVADVLTAVGGSYAVTGTSVGSKVTMPAAGGAYVLTGTAATLTDTGGAPLPAGEAYLPAVRRRRR